MRKLARNPHRVCKKLYCARGDKENRIKERQFDLFADRTTPNGRFGRRQVPQQSNLGDSPDHELGQEGHDLRKRGDDHYP